MGLGRRPSFARPVGYIARRKENGTVLILSKQKKKKRNSRFPGCWVLNEMNSDITFKLILARYETGNCRLAPNVDEYGKDRRPRRLGS